VPPFSNVCSSAFTSANGHRIYGHRILEEPKVEQAAEGVWKGSGASGAARTQLAAAPAEE
jgi:hypothetical protein